MAKYDDVAARALGLLLGVAADRLLGDPRRFHPVAGFGKTAAALERRVWADSRARGICFAAGGVAGVVIPAAVLQRRLATRPVANAIVTAVATWAVIGARTLTREARALHDELARGEVGAARQRVDMLVSRDASRLDASEIARAGVETVAENTSDAVVAPLFWGALAGIPGLLGYRAINTLDAMVGYRNARYERFGWATARLDDLANLAPSRLTALLVAAFSRDRSRVRRATGRDARRHPSPNAGWCEAAFAASLGVQLGGTNDYGRHLEHRPLIGDGRAPAACDLVRAAALCRRVTAGGALLAAGIAVGARAMRARAGRARAARG